MFRNRNRNRRPKSSENRSRRRTSLPWWFVTEMLLIPIGLLLWLTWPQGTPPTPRAVALWAWDLARSVAGK